MPSRLAGGLIGAVAGAHLTLCILVAWRPFRAVGLLELSLATAAAGFALGYWFVGNWLIAVRRRGGKAQPGCAATWLQNFEQPVAREERLLESSDLVATRSQSLDLPETFGDDGDAFPLRVDAGHLEVWAADHHVEVHV